MATNNFRFNVITEDTDGNTSSENVSVNIGPAECTPPTVEFVFPSGVRARVGNSSNPAWTAGNTLASVFCKVFPTVRPDEGGTGNFLVQCYSDIDSYPNAPASRFEQTFEGVGGQLEVALSDQETSSLVISSGTGVTGSGLYQSTDLAGLRKALHITNTANAQVVGTTTTSFGTTVTIPSSPVDVLDTDEVIAAWHHNLANNFVYTLERGANAFGRPLQSWPVGTSVSTHPYHYVPMYSNITLSDVLVKPHILVQEIGTQYPLTGRMNVASNVVDGTNTDFLNEISGGIGTGSYHVSGATNVIKFEGSDSWYIVSGVTSSSGLVIYNYGDSLSLTNQPAQINCYTLGSGTVAIEPDLAGCSSWGVTLSPQYQNGDTVPSLTVDYTANVGAVIAGGAISGTPSYQWEVLSGTTSPTWSGLVPGNLATQTVLYETDIAKRIRVTVSGSGQAACRHQYDTGDIAISESTSAGVWNSVQGTALGANSQIESLISSELQGTRLATKYYHHNLTAMKTKTTLITSTVSSSSSTINVTPGQVSSWPTKGTVIIIGGNATVNSISHRIYHRFTYTGKTNSSLTGVTHWGNFGMPASALYDQTKMVLASTGFSANSGSAIYVQTMQPHPFSMVEAVTSYNTVTLRDVRGINNGSTNKWVRFAPLYTQTNYIGTGGTMIEQPYRITAVNTASKSITLDRPLHTSIVAGMACVMQPYVDETVGNFYPNGTSEDRLNFFNTAAWFAYGNTPQTVTRTSSATVYIWDPMQRVVGANFSEEKIRQMRLPPIGRLVLPRSDNNKGVVIEYNGIQGPLSGSVVNGVQTGSTIFSGQFKLLNVRIVSSLSDTSVTNVSIGPRTLLVPYQEFDFLDVGVLSFSPSDASISYSFNGGTIEHPGYCTPIIDRVFATSSLSNKISNSNMTRVPAITNYEEQHYIGWPTAGLRSQPPIFINDPNAGSASNTGGSTGTGDGTQSDQYGCIHYDSIVEIWNGEYFEKMLVKDVQIDSFIRTPQGAKRVTNKIESRHSKTNVIGLNNGKSLHCTAVHPIAVLDDKAIGWKQAGEVKVGDIVVTDDGSDIVAVNIAINLDGKTVHPFYDLTVEDVHKFYANSILVHNKTFDQYYDL